MYFLKILGMGFIGVALVLAAFFLQVRRERLEKENGRKVMLALTPEKLIANCGQPYSDDQQTETFEVQTDVFVVQTTRVIKYKTRLAKFEFERFKDRIGGLHPWKFIHYGSEDFGTTPDDENSYGAVQEMPCLAKNRRPSLLHLIFPDLN
jgi:hypothetical protein